MALGTITLAEHAGGQTLEPLWHDYVSFLGDNSYPAGGTPNFSTLVAAALGKEGVNIIGVTVRRLRGRLRQVCRQADAVRVPGRAWRCE